MQYKDFSWALCGAGELIHGAGQLTSSVDMVYRNAGPIGYNGITK